MAIIGWPEDVQHDDTVPCVICKKQIRLEEASAGLRGSNGQQTFACDEHHYNIAKLIVGWTDFASAERQQMAFLEAVGHESRLY